MSLADFFFSSFFVFRLLKSTIFLTLLIHISYLVHHSGLEKKVWQPTLWPTSKWIISTWLQSFWERVL